MYYEEKCTHVSLCFLLNMIIIDASLENNFHPHPNCKITAMQNKIHPVCKQKYCVIFIYASFTISNKNIDSCLFILKFFSFVPDCESVFNYKMVDFLIYRAIFCFCSCFCCFQGFFSFSQ